MSNKQSKIDRLQQEWLKKPREERKTEEHILIFYAEMKRHHPALLRIEGVTGDTYQYLKTILELEV